MYMNTTYCKHLQYVSYIFRNDTSAQQLEAYETNGTYDKYLGSMAVDFLETINSFFDCL